MAMKILLRMHCITPGGKLFNPQIQMSRRHLTCIVLCFLLLLLFVLPQGQNGYHKQKSRTRTLASLAAIFGGNLICNLYAEAFWFCYFLWAGVAKSWHSLFLILSISLCVDPCCCCCCYCFAWWRYVLLSRFITPAVIWQS